jgi:hypothetical protein
MRHCLACWVLAQLAELAENAGKHRTAEWLLQCAAAHAAGEPWPEAPRYKGPLQDLDALTDEALVELSAAILKEQRSRGTQT